MSMGGSSTPSTQTVTSKEVIPKYLEDYSLENIDSARAIADTPYEPYTGARLADFTTAQKSAFDTVETNSAGAPLYGAYDPAVDAATAGTTAEYGDTWTPSDVQNWMSPYVDSALTPTLAGIDRDALVAERKINAGATAAGAFGDARTGVQLGENDRNTAQLRSDATALAYDKAYESALSSSGKAFGANADQYNADFKNQLASGSLLTDSLAAKYDYSAKTVDDLLEVGALEKTQDQQDLDTAYEDYLNQQEYPSEMLNLKLAAQKGTPYTTTRLTTTPYSSTAQGIGALSSLYGLIGKTTA